ncbi:hypothetical protein BTS2_0994 [Bacillus sp. TS-2]|nr:hypothetical protein BTS2_0994 [Bacillus sp. TS-2]
MTQEHPSKLSFSIEESVWLNKGQEVKEILSMSLEPDIVIEEKNQHVYIKGGLQLVGEYRAVSKEESDLNPEESLEEQLTYRSVEEVEVDEEGKGEIKHFFPIDVTIPLSRIQNLDDIFVDVENFDYDLPEKSCIQLTADIGISGMSTVQDAPVNATIEEEAEEETVRETEDEKSFSFDSRKEAQTIAPLNVVNTEPPQEIDHNLTEPSNNLFLEPKNSEEEETEVKGQYQQNFEEEKLSTIIDSIEEKQKEEQRKQPSANSKQPEEQVNSKVERVEQKKELELMRTVSEEIEEETEEETVEHHTPQRKSENALYLTKMLTKGEENFSRWKMCIIQENESLDSIAERYEISTTQLVRFNRLKEEKVEEGQILYIPVTNQ